MLSTKDVGKGFWFPSRNPLCPTYAIHGIAQRRKLVGVSGITIYNWEHGTSRPRKAQLAALAAVRGIGKRAALKKLAELTPG